jgi:hypothetical protein
MSQDRRRTERRMRRCGKEEAAGKKGRLQGKEEVATS